MPRARSGRAEKSLYHTRQLFVNRKIKQIITLPDPVICVLLPIAFLIVIAYNNNCQGESLNQQLPHRGRNAHKKIKNKGKTP